jgi:hypothetical protein
MQLGKILSIAVVTVASLIVIAAAVIAIAFFGFFRSGSQQNFALSEGPQAVSPVGDIILVSQTSGSSSFLYRKDPSGGKSVRLTTALNGIESEASFSHNGKLVVYSFANSPDSKSSVWVVGTDGSNPHAITGEDDDALHPVFSPDDSKLFYAASSFTGHYSPVVRPARHDWDIFSLPVQSNVASAGVAPTRISHESFYDLKSLDAAPDEAWGGTKLLISTSAYPIGSSIEEFNAEAKGKTRIFQPHVPGEPSLGAEYGEARFSNDRMSILFLAATNTAGGNYDYDVFSRSEVTGSQIKQLTHLKGTTTDLKVLPGGKATFVNGGVTYSLDISTQTAKPI